MTKRLDEAISKIRKLSPDRQEDAADLLFSLLEQEEAIPAPLTPKQVEQVKAAIERANAGDFASDEEVEAVFKKHGA